MAAAAEGTVRFVVPVTVAFDYLVDPQHRPEWQSSLRRVEDVEGAPRAGQTWTDVTVPGLRAEMVTEVLERPRVWAESGSWRFVRADLTLRFEPIGDDACEVTYRFRIHALGPLGLAATALSALAVRRDLRRAARLVEARV